MRLALMASRVRLKVRRSTSLAFIATTVALVLLTSLGTAVLVHYGSGGSGVVPPRVIAPASAGPADGPGGGDGVPPLERVIGSFHTPSASGTQASGSSLRDLLSPPQINLPRPRPSSSGEPVAPLTLPTQLPTALPTAPAPSPVAVPVPVPVPFPGPITVPLPAPLPDIVLFPGGLVSPSPSPLPVP